MVYGGPRALPEEHQSQHHAAKIDLFATHKPEGLPQELHVYLTTTSRPTDIFTCLQDDQDRRLRLLVRRFTNQIQFGCRNPECDSPTCLSYRKRHARKPVRPYTDVAARALAWHCVEAYATSNQGPTQGELPSVTKRGAKTKSRSYCNIPGLCWNEPVVPWYDDPSEVRRRHKAVADRTKHGANTVNPELSTVARSENSGANGQPKRSEPNTASEMNESHVPSAVSSQRSGDRSMKPSWNNKREKHHRIPGEEQREEHDLSSASVRHFDKRHVSFAEPVENHVKLEQSTKKDTASFTQMLYDASSIKHFDHSHSGPRSHDQQREAIQFPRSNVMANEGTKVDDVFSNNHTTQIHRQVAQSVSTFKILPLSAALWLRSTMPYDAQRSPHRDLSTTTDHGSYSMFARQSLYYSLSNPSTLLKSSKTWHFIHHQPFKLNEQTLARTIQNLASKEKGVLESPHEHTLPQPGGIMVAFGMLIAMTSIPEVLNHLFSALQHAYVLPKWLRRSRKKSSSLSAEEVMIEPTVQHDALRKAPPGKGKMSATSQISDSDHCNYTYLENPQVAQISMLILLALQLVIALKPPMSQKSAPHNDFYTLYSESRNSGSMFTTSRLSQAWSKDPEARAKYQAYTTRLDMMDDWRFTRLLDAFADVLSHRLAIDAIQRATMRSFVSDKPKGVVDLLVDEIIAALKKPDQVIHKQVMQKNIIDLLRSIILRRWNRDAVIQKCGPVGGALEVLAAIYRRKQELGIAASEFQWTFVADAFDELEMPMKWLEFREDNIQTHILAYSFLFEPASLVVYFRAINSTLMRKSHESAEVVYKNARQFLCDTPFNVYGTREALAEIRPNMAKYFVLTIRRSDMLQDAMNQIWRRQVQELMRPLKVRLGKDEGEDGLDHGGVQAEFFRIVFAEALDPSFGMFTIDDRTRMTWFQPGSFEPLYKFESLGLLMSLAVYNGVTLPITFPLAFYRKLLGLRVKTLPHIMDGWLDLGRGLQQLLDWKDGDVGNVIARTYEFSYEAFGVSHTIDMSERSRNDTWKAPNQSQNEHKFKPSPFQFTAKDWNSDSEGEPGKIRKKSSYSASPKSTSSASKAQTPTANAEAPLVTNANRDQYVKDYIHWLTDRSIAPQFKSFAKGFHTCIDRTALSIFTPEHLKTVVEGHQHIDIDGLQATATYDEYKTSDEVVVWFWQAVRDMSPDQHRKLLEFVTASDRVPVNGIQSVVFIIQRNGDGDERLPSSSTCYGRLLLPRYSSKAVLSAKLEKAIENSVGFGSL